MLVVIAESDRLLAKLIADVGTTAGHTPLVTASGRHALEIVRDQHPALLIADLILSDLDGLSLIIALGPERRTWLQTFLVSASPKELRTVGASALLPLPFRISDLEAILARLLPAPLHDEWRAQPPV